MINKSEINDAIDAVLERAAECRAAGIKKIAFGDQLAVTFGERSVDGDRKAEAASGGLEIPELGPRDDEGWAEYTRPVRLDPETAATAELGDDDPTEAILGFYAALMRGEDVRPRLLEPDSDMIGRKLERLEAWSFQLVVIRALRLRGRARATARLYLEVEIDGKRDSGTDQIKLRRAGGDDGPWRIERPPT